MALLDAAVVLVILLGCSTLGLRVRPLLSERHRSREVIDFVQLVVAMLVTFAALVLGLLTSSVKTSFDKVGDDLRGLAIQLIQLDRSLREWGTIAQPTHDLLRAYTAAAIATTWTREPKPPGDYYPSEAPPGSGSELETCWLEASSLFASLSRTIRCIAGYKPRASPNSSG